MGYCWETSTRTTLLSDGNSVFNASYRKLTVKGKCRDTLNGSVSCLVLPSSKELPAHLVFHVGDKRNFQEIYF